MITEKTIAHNSDTAREDTREFISALMLCDDVLPVPITWEDAAYDISNWIADGVDIPAGMTPELYAATWNELIMEV